MSAPQPRFDPRSGEAGFTMIEMLIATMLMVFILVALATVTAQWLPNWNRGMARIERDERLAFALNRVVGDLSVAEFVPVNAKAKAAYFNGDELGLSFVRTAIGPNAQPGLEIVHYHEVGDAGGPALIREHARFVPMDAAAPVQFADPTVLIRSPFRVTFAYAGTDDNWQPFWRGAALLPSRIRVTVRDGITQQALAVSTATLVHVDTPAECARAQNPNQCMTQLVQAVTNANKTPAATEPQGGRL
jgi:general secretion pathway protein J